MNCKSLRKNFAARSALLSKGGAHTRSKSVARRAARAAIDEELFYLDADAERGRGRKSLERKNGRCSYLPGNPEGVGVRTDSSDREVPDRYGPNWFCPSLVDRLELTCRGPTTDAEHVPDFTTPYPTGQDVTDNSAWGRARRTHGDSTSSSNKQ